MFSLAERTKPFRPLHPSLSRVRAFAPDVILPVVVIVIDRMHTHSLVDASMVTFIIHDSRRSVGLIDVERRELPAICSRMIESIE
jgi:hypothetical protein